MSTITQPTSSNAKKSYDDQFIFGTVTKESREETASGAGTPEAKGRHANERLFEEVLKRAQTDFPHVSLPEMPASSEISYNDITSGKEEQRHGDNSDIQTIQQLRAAFSNPEAEAASNAATLMLLFISLMGDFQKAKANAIINNLDSILSRMSTRISEMEKEKNAAYKRDMVSFGGELLVNTTSLFVSIAGGLTSERTRSSLLEEQNNLSMVHEYNSLANTQNASDSKIPNQQNNERIETIKEHFNAIERAKNGNPTSDPKVNSLIPEVHLIKAKIEHYQTQIASYEARFQFTNSIATFLKGAFTCASAELNRDASEAKINETQAEQGKEKINTDTQLDRDSASVTREACMKLLAILEKMLEAMPENTKAIARNVRT